MKRVLLFLFVILLVACSTPPPTETPEATAQLELQLADTRTPRPTRTPRSTPTIAPTATNTATPTNTPTVTPQPPIPPFVDALPCPEEAHNPRMWHSIWNETLGCFYRHFHADNPHDMDAVFGTIAYEWMGGELSSPWQTFSGAGPHHEQPGSEACMELDCKGNFYRVYNVADFPCGQAPGAQNCVINARIWAHIDPAQIGAKVRFHSLFLEVEVCTLDGLNCGKYHGGGHWDSGKLNIPRGTYIPLTGDPIEWASRPAEGEPYRIECELSTTIPCLESWQSEGSAWEVPEGDIRILTGFGVHLGDTWGPVDMSISGNPLSPENILLTHFYCDGEFVDFVFYPEPGCRYNGSEATVFRVWATIPDELDNGVYDTNPIEGVFSFEGYTDRYGKIVEGCTESALDCVPALAENMPVGQGGLRGGTGMGYDREYDICHIGDEITDCSENGAKSLGWLVYP